MVTTGTDRSNESDVDEVLAIERSDVQPSLLLESANTEHLAIFVALLGVLSGRFSAELYYIPP